MKIENDKKAGKQKQFSLICTGLVLALLSVPVAIADTYNDTYPDDCDAMKLKLLPEFTDQSIGTHPENCTASNLKLPAWSNARGWINDAYELTITLANVTGDARLELIGRDPVGVNVQGYELDPDKRWWGAWLPRYSAETRQADLADPEWMSPEQYLSIRFIDLDGDGTDEMVAHDAGRNGLGLVAYRFIGGDDQARGNWEPINEAGFILPAHTDWTRPEYYQTFLVGKINPGSAEQLLVRSVEGVIGFQWDDDISNFKNIEEMTANGPLSDAEGWDKKIYYSSLQLVDIDGDGYDELIGRGNAGLYGYNFEPESGWTNFARPAGLVSDVKLNNKFSYQTMTWGNFKDSSKASLAIWKPLVNSEGSSEDEQYGVLLIEWDAGKKEWSQSQMREDLYYWFFIFQGFSTSFRAADMDGDGLDELHLLDRQFGGLRSYKFSANTNGAEWKLVNTGNEEDEFILFSRGLTIHLGDITGDGSAEAIGRSEAGLETYFYDRESQRWEENFSCGFPDFTDAQAKAYATMNQMRFAGATEFRHQYNDSSANASNLSFLLRNQQRPGGASGNDTSYTQTDWEAVRCQLLRENDWANSVMGVFVDQHNTFDAKYTSEWELADTVGGTLIKSINAKKGIEIEVIFEALLLGGIDLATGGIATAAFKNGAAREATKGILSGMGDLAGSIAMSSVIRKIFPPDLTAGNITRIKDQLHDKKQDALTELEMMAAEITGYVNQKDAQEGDLGSMAAVGLLHRRGYWPANFSKDAFVQDRSRWAFKRWLYQQILTTVYEVRIFDCGDIIEGITCREPSPSRTRICYNTYEKKIVPNPDSFGSWKCDFGNTVYYPNHYKWIYLAVEQKGWSKYLTLPEDVVTTLTQKVGGECAQAGKYYVSKCSLGLDINDLLQRRNGWDFTLKNTSSYADNTGQPGKSLSCAGLAATITGTEDADIIFGTSGPDVIVTVGGNDIIYAGGGDDIICSGDGNDRVYGGAGDDRIILGYGNDYGIGGAGDDWISSESGQNSLYGGQGNDVLEGGYEDSPD